MAAAILALPAELHLLILDFAGPAAHFPYALTCKTFHAVAFRLLQHHRRCFSLYRCTSDILPLTVLGLCRTASREPIAAWHIRDLEVWSTRRRWKDWTIHRLRDRTQVTRSQVRSILATQEVQVDYSAAGQTGTLLSQEERSRLCDLLISILHLDKGQIARCRDGFMAGDEELIRICLYALAPNLRSITFMRMGLPPHSPSTTLYNEASCPISFFTRTVLGLYNLGLPADAWPLGYRNLRIVTVGVDTGLSKITDLTRNFAIVTVESILPLFGLPSLRELSILFPILSIQHQTRHSSPWSIRGDYVETQVQKVFFQDLGDSISNTTCDSRTKFRATLQYARHLRSFHTLTNILRADSLLDVLLEAHARTLESLQLNCWWARIFVEGELRRFPALRHAVINLDMMQGRDGRQQKSYSAVDHRLVTATTLADILPPSTITLSLASTYTNQLLSHEWEGTLDNIFANTLLQRSLPHLKAIFLGPFFDVETLYSTPPGATWGRTFMASQDSNVEIFGGGTHDPKYISQRLGQLGVPRFVLGNSVMSDPRKDPAKWTERFASADKAARLCQIIRRAKELERARAA